MAHSVKWLIMCDIGELVWKTDSEGNFESKYLIVAYFLKVFHSIFCSIFQSDDSAQSWIRNTHTIVMQKNIIMEFFLT